MATPTDFLHTGDVVDAVLDVLRGADGDTHTGGLPANWFPASHDDDEVPLEILQHGDLADYVSADDVLGDTPAVLVRGLGPLVEGREVGKYRTVERVRIVHVRKHDHCRDSSGDREKNYTKARERYAKLIGKALMNDPHKRLATIAADGTRTEADITGATVHDVQLVGWDLGYDAGSMHSMQEVAQWRAITNASWAIGCEIDVRLKT